MPPVNRSPPVPPMRASSPPPPSILSLSGPPSRRVVEIAAGHGVEAEPGAEDVDVACSAEICHRRFRSRRSPWSWQ